MSASDDFDRCFYSWPDANNVRVHVCIQTGEHEHMCAICGPSVTPPSGGGA